MAQQNGISRGEKLMMDYWRAVITDNYDSAMDLERQVNLTLKYGIIANIEVGYNASSSWLLTFEDGMKAIFTPKGDGASYPAVEVHKLDQMLRFLVTSPIVMRDDVRGKNGSLQLFLPNAKEGGVDLRTPGANYPSDRMFVLDKLTGNVDRNGRNWLEFSGGHILAIDNEAVVVNPEYKTWRALGPVASDELRPISMDTFAKLQDFDRNIMKAEYRQEAAPTLTYYAQLKAMDLLNHNYKHPMIGSERPSVCRKMFSHW